MIGVNIPCGPGLECPSFYGYLTIIMAFVIFVGSIYLLLAAVFGIRMGYLVLSVAFFGWMILFSAIWVFGTGAPASKNLGPRGVEPHWQPISAGITVTSGKYPVVKRYPNGPWKGLGPGTASSVQSVQTSIQEYMAEQANEELKVDPESENALQVTDFTVENVRFTTSGDVSLAGATAFYNNGGPIVRVFAYHDTGDVPIYSWAFFAASILGFLVHLPFLDRAERRRKAVLTGGARPPWYGPA
ncbi:MAG: hypothetical protein ABR600_11135 [Actinomycetota bacterium]